MATYGPIRYGGIINSGALTGTVTYTNTTDLPTSNVGTGQRAYVTSTNKLYVWNGNAWFTIALIDTRFNATGGTVSTYTSDGTDYKVHTFTSSGTFSVSSGARNYFIFNCSWWRWRRSQCWCWGRSRWL